MDPLGAWTTLLASAALTLWTTFELRPRLPVRVVTALLAIGGAGLGFGGLLFVRDVGIASWVVAPAALAVLVPAHVRVLFAGEGPLRT
ncbi:MAG: hypothetical protein ACXVQJ_05665 [Actinomycetota bacterium]